MTETIHQARVNYGHGEGSSHLTIAGELTSPRLLIREIGDANERRHADIYMNRAQWLELAAVAQTIADAMEDSTTGNSGAEHLTNDDVLQWQDENRRVQFETELKNMIDYWASFTWDDGWANGSSIIGVTDKHFEELVERGYMERREVRFRVEHRLTKAGRSLASPL